MFLIICGPTASGKSSLAVKIALERNGEVISADSMQVYKGMDIGTGKITKEEMRGVRHHLLSFLDPNENYSAARFKKDCERCLDDIKSRGKFPIICGGTGLYIDAVINGLFEEENIKPGLREELNEMLSVKGLDFMVKLLAEKDPEIIKEIDIKNPRRVLRCLEIIEANNEKASVMRAKAAQNAYKDDYDIICLMPEREELNKRIDARVERMFEYGLVDEVKNLLDAGIKKESTSMQAIGYKETVSYIEGKAGLEDTINLVKKATRAYAKRQATWFKKYAVKK